MGASKTQQFTKDHINLSLVARALSHPARIAIVEHLKQVQTCRNVDLIPLLRLSKTTVHQHIMMLRDAELVDCRFMESAYLISLNSSSMDDFSEFIGYVMN